MITKTGDLRFPAASLWCALALALCMPAAWSDEVRIVTQPVAPGESVTIVNQPAAPPEQSVTIVKEPAQTTTIRHESVIDSDDDSVSSIIVKTAPPEPRQEVVRVEQRPAEGYTFVSGYWRWDADRNTYEWVPGVWRRTVPGMTWHTGHWIEFKNGWQWVPGYWSNTPAETSSTATTTTTTTRVDTDGDRDTDLVVVQQAPPAPRQETRTASPGADYVWIAGHWEYRDNEYRWINGRWERPASDGMIWVPARWIRRPDHTYTFISGHWDYPVESRAYFVARDPDDDGIVDRSSNLEKDNAEIRKPGNDRDGDNR